jgi:hypothetical protein
LPDANGRDEIGEPCFQQCEPSLFGELGPGAGDDEPRRGKKVVFTQDEVGQEVARRPRIKERRSLRAQFVQQIAELLALDGVEGHFGHGQRA